MAKNGNSDNEKLFRQLSSLDTESRNPRTMEIDLAGIREIARLINEEDKTVAFQIEKKLDNIAEVIELVEAAFSAGGRLIYAGAGTSGRLGILDAAECPPTFGVPQEQVQAIIAGGKEAVFVAQEGAEDSPQTGAGDIIQKEVAPPDIVCGLAASGRTPYVKGALEEARRRNCKTVLVTTVPAEQTQISADYIIDIPVGPEVIMGSTRMKSATAQKMVLNMITTGAMIRQGKIYENVMVDLMLTNAKLHERAKRILMMLCEVEYGEASELLIAANGHVKTAMVMAFAKLDAENAKKLLAAHQGFVRKTLLSLKNI